MKVPVTRFDVRAYKVYFDYAAWTFTQEYVITVAGVGSNSALFIFMGIFALFCKKFCDCFPRRWY